MSQTSVSLLSKTRLLLAVGTQVRLRLSNEYFEYNTDIRFDTLKIFIAVELMKRRQYCCYFNRFTCCFVVVLLYIHIIK